MRDKGHPSLMEAREGQDKTSHGFLQSILCQPNWSLSDKKMQNFVKMKEELWENRRLSVEFSVHGLFVRF